MSSVVKKSSALTVADYFLYKANKEKNLEDQGFTNIFADDT